MPEGVVERGRRDCGLGGARLSKTQFVPKRPAGHTVGSRRYARILAAAISYLAYVTVQCGIPLRPQMGTSD